MTKTYEELNMHWVVEKLLNQMIEGRVYRVVRYLEKIAFTEEFSDMFTEIESIVFDDQKSFIRKKMIEQPIEVRDSEYPYFQSQLVIVRSNDAFGDFFEALKLMDFYKSWDEFEQGECKEILAHIVNDLIQLWSKQIKYDDLIMDRFGVAQHTYYEHTGYIQLMFDKSTSLPDLKKYLDEHWDYMTLSEEEFENFKRDEEKKKQRNIIPSDLARNVELYNYYTEHQHEHDKTISIQNKTATYIHKKYGKELSAKRVGEIMKDVQRKWGAK